MSVSQERNVVHAENAPKAIGPYSVAIQTKNLIFTSGQISLVPETGEIITGGIEDETRQVLTNLKNILEEAGSSLDLVVKTTVFLQTMEDFPKMNAIYAGFFPENPPARTTVAVAGLPKGARIEIEAIALRKE